MARIINPAVPQPIAVMYPRPAAYGCVLHYDMQDRGDLARDHSGHGSHGLIQGATAVPGRTGHRMEFDGVDDGLIVSGVGAGSGPEDITVLATVEFRSLGTHSQCIAASGETVWMLRVDESNRRIHWDCVSDMGFDWMPDSIAILNIETGVRYRIAGVFQTIRPFVLEQDPGMHRIALYLDGELASESIQDGAPMASWDPLIHVGRLSSFYPMSGWMEDFKVFNRALTESEIRQYATQHQ